MKKIFFSFLYISAIFSSLGLLFCIQMSFCMTIDPFSFSYSICFYLFVNFFFTFSFCVYPSVSWIFKAHGDCNFWLYLFVCTIFIHKKDINDTYLMINAVIFGWFKAWFFFQSCLYLLNLQRISSDLSPQIYQVLVLLLTNYLFCTSVSVFYFFWIYQYAV